MNCPTCKVPMKVFSLYHDVCPKCGRIVVV